MVPAEGIEPPTFGLQNRCSTAELCRHLIQDGRTILIFFSSEKGVCAEKYPDNSKNKNVTLQIVPIPHRVG